MRDPRILVPRALLQLWLEFGPTAPLEPAIRRFMEARLGADLGDERDACEHEAERLAVEALDGGLRPDVTPDRSGARAYP
jgi:hypothetical protein